MGNIFEMLFFEQTHWNKIVEKRPLVGWKIFVKFFLWTQKTNNEKIIRNWWEIYVFKFFCEQKHIQYSNGKYLGKVFNKQYIYEKMFKNGSVCGMLAKKKLLSALPLGQNYIGAKQLKRVYRVCNTIKNYIWKAFLWTLKIVQENT